MSELIWKSDQVLYTKANDELETLRFTWIIDDFMNLDVPNGEYIMSRLFHSNNYNWSLQVYPNGKDKVGKDCVSLYLILNGPMAPGVNATMMLCILNEENELVLKGGTYSANFPVGGGFGEKTLICRSKLLNESKIFMNDNKLRIGVEIKIKNLLTVPTEFRSNFGKVISVHRPDFSEFVKSKALSDVELINANNEAIPAHKIVLTGQSPVFAAMFKHKYKESIENQVEVKGISARALDQMLSYIYTEKFENIDNQNIELIQELLHAADQYDIIPLKKYCEKMLIIVVSIDNVLVLLELADTYKCTYLKKSTLECIEMKKDTLLKTSDWKEFIVKNPELANEVILKLSNVAPYCDLDVVFD